MATLRSFCKPVKSCSCSRFFSDVFNVSCKNGGYGLDLKTYPNGMQTEIFFGC